MNTEQKIAMYSDALISIINKESQFKIGNDIIYSDRESGKFYKIGNKQTFSPSTETTALPYGTVINSQTILQQSVAVPTCKSISQSQPQFKNHKHLLGQPQPSCRSIQ